MFVSRSLHILLLSALAPWVSAQDCELALSRSEVDYGSLNRTTLKGLDGEVSLPPRSLQLTLQCASEQALQLSYRALAASSDAFRFGAKGRYQLWLSDARLDDRPVALGLVNGAGLGAARSGQDMPLPPEQALLPLHGGQALIGRRLQARMEVRSVGPQAVLHTPNSSEWLAQGSLVGNGAERELRLRAAFTPASCTPRLGQGGVVDFGRIGSGQLAQRQVTRLERGLSLTVQCDGPTRFALSAKDNRAGSALPVPGQEAATLFGLGTTQAGGAVGSFRLRIDAPNAGAPLWPVQAAPAGVTWRRVPGEQAAVAHGGQWLGFSLDASAGEAAGPSALDGLSAQVQVELYLAPLEALKLREETPIQGSATLEIIYL